MTAVRPAASGSTARATVVIVNYNGAHLLGPCLDGLRKQDLPADAFHTVVVDNASADSSLDLLHSEYPDVEIIASPVNTGFAGGNNLALRRLETDVAVLLNNDAVPEPSWLRELLSAFDAPGAERVGAVTGKVVFMPRFLRLRWQVPGFVPGPHDSRELGARVFGVEVAPADGSAPAQDVIAKVLWERMTFGAEGSGADRFWWTRPDGELLVPVPSEFAGRPLVVTFVVAAQPGVTKALTVSGPGLAPVTSSIGEARSSVRIEVPADIELKDVINNVGGIVLASGHGADRGFQEIDDGQYETPTEVFAACGNGMAIRRVAGEQVGWFDDDFFMYYEDTDLSWRLRADGWTIRYVPTAQLRHIHSASSKEWSPRWVFHVERNRLLMLTKDATARLAGSAVIRFVLTAGSMGLRSAREAVRTRRRPAVRPHLLRARVFASYLRLLPRMLARRHRITAAATVPRAELERGLVTAR